MLPSLEQLIAAFMGVDNAARKEAEVVWEQIKESSPDQATEGLCRILAGAGEGGAPQGQQTGADEPQRAMAAVLLRSLFSRRSDTWQRIQPSTRFALRECLLRSVVGEPAGHIRLKVAHTIGQVADASLSGPGQAGQAGKMVVQPEQTWPELMQLTLTLCAECSSSSPSSLDTVHRAVVGLTVVEKLAEYAGQALKPHALTLLEIFASGLRHPSDVGVRVAALKAACSFLQDESMDAHALTLCSPLIPQMLQVVGEVLNEGKEDLAVEALSCLTVVADKQPTLLRASVREVGQAMEQLAQSRALEVGTREVALEFFVSFCERDPGAVRKVGASVLGSMVPIIVDMLSQLEDDDDEEGQGGGQSSGMQWAQRLDFGQIDFGAGGLGADGDGEGEDAEGEEVSDVAAVALDRIATAVGGKMVLNVAFPLIRGFLADGGDWKKRRAALLALALLSDGCQKDMHALLPEMLPPLLHFAGDPHPRVRWQLLFCLRRMSELFTEQETKEGPSFQEMFHAQVVPVLVASLSPEGVNAGMPRLQALAALSVAVFASPAHCAYRHLAFQKDALLSGLLQLLSQPNPHVVVLQEALSAVANVANVIGGHFLPYYAHFMGIAKGILQAPGGDDKGQVVLLRGKAVEGMAMAGNAVGKQHFRQDAHDMMAVLGPLVSPSTDGAGNANDQHVDLGYVQMGCARIAGVLGKDFAPYLSAVLPPLLRTVARPSQFKVFEDDGVSNPAAARAEMEAEGMVAISCDIRGLGTQIFGLNTSAMQEKQAALQTLYQYAVNMGCHLRPFAGEAYSAVRACLQEGKMNPVQVRTCCCALLPKLFDACTRITNSATEQERGFAAEVGANILQGSCEALMEAIRAEKGDDSDEGGGMAADGLEALCLAAHALNDILRISRESTMGGDDGGGAGNPTTASSSSSSSSSSRRVPIPVAESLLRPIVCLLRDKAIVSIDRSQQRAAIIAGDEFIGEDAFEEEEEWEDDLMTSVTDSLGWLLKAKGPAMLPLFQELLFAWVWGMLLPGGAGHGTGEQEAGQSMPLPDSLRSCALCMCIDVVEHCGEGGHDLIRDLLPLCVALLRGGGEESGMRQAAAYGIGVMAEGHRGAHFDGGGSQSQLAQSSQTQSVGGEALEALLAMIRAAQSTGEGGTDVENAVSACIKILIHRPSVRLPGGMERVGLMGQLLSLLPIREDIIEAHDCHRYVISLAEQGHPVLLGEGSENVPVLLFGLLQCMVYQTSEQEDADLAAGLGIDPPTAVPPTAAAGAGAGDGAAVQPPTHLSAETREELWGRQLVDEDSRRRLEALLQGVQSTHGTVFETVVGQLEAAGLRRDQMLGLTTDQLNQRCKEEL